MKPKPVPVATDDSLRWKRFIFNAVIGVMFIVSASGFAMLGMLGILSIIGAAPGFWLLICSVVLYACGARLLLGALLDG